MFDAELENAIKQIKNAEQNGFITFFNRTFHYVYTRSKYLFSNLTECREFIKQVYLFIFLHIAEAAQNENLEKWLSKCILSCYHNLLLQNGIDAFAEIENKSSLSTSLPAENENPKNCMDKESCARILARQLKQLPVLPRILFLSFYHDGLSSMEIATLFGCSEAAVLWELEHTKDFLIQAYENAAPTNGQVLYPFNLQLVYHALELQNQKFASTKEFARLVWESIASELTFKKAPRKKVFTLPLFCCFSILILAFILLTMYSGGYFGHSSKKTEQTTNDEPGVIYEGTESEIVPYSQDDLKPSSTTTIKDENGNVTTYDENGSEIPTPK